MDHRRVVVVVAPEVAERIVARRAAGEHATEIAHDLHMTPFEVSGVIRAAARAAAVQR